MDVAIEAVQPGPDGNVGSGAITVMPTPPPGVNSVTNAAPTGGGRAAEPDEQLRERAKHTLERAGNSTLGAIKFAVLGIDGVDGVEVLDFSRDGSIPLGEVRVRYSAGSPEKVGAKVEAVVESTRAAGIHAILEAITSVLISGIFYVIPDVGGVQAGGLRSLPQGCDRRARPVAHRRAAVRPAPDRVDLRRTRPRGRG